MGCHKLFRRVRVCVAAISSAGWWGPDALVAPKKPRTFHGFFLCTRVLRS